MMSRGCIADKNIHTHVRGDNFWNSNSLLLEYCSFQLYSSAVCNKSNFHFHNLQVMLLSLCHWCYHSPKKTWQAYSPVCLPKYQSHWHRSFLRSSQNRVQWRGKVKGNAKSRNYIQKVGLLHFSDGAESYKRDMPTHICKYCNGVWTQQYYDFFL